MFFVLIVNQKQRNKWRQKPMELTIPTNSLEIKNQQ